jgi:hypothetical protein
MVYASRERPFAPTRYKRADSSFIVPHIETAIMSFDASSDPEDMVFEAPRQPTRRSLFHSNERHGARKSRYAGQLDDDHAMHSPRPRRDEHDHGHHRDVTDSSESDEEEVMFRTPTKSRTPNAPKKPRRNVQRIRMHEKKLVSEIEHIYKIFNLVRLYFCLLLFSISIDSIFCVNEFSSNSLVSQKPKNPEDVVHSFAETFRFMLKHAQQFDFDVDVIAGKIHKLTRQLLDENPHTEYLHDIERIDMLAHYAITRDPRMYEPAHS